MTNQQCAICEVTKYELKQQRRYNHRTVPCLTIDYKHIFKGIKRVKIDPNQLEFMLQ